MISFQIFLEMGNAVMFYKFSNSGLFLCKGCARSLETSCSALIIKGLSVLFYKRGFEFGVPKGSTLNKLVHFH